ncbi:MAG: response regulator transcription factor [Kineosporiaceae bacterium]|nr:response regulator transcription factor [Kineosporiaceae bacterium]
MRDTPIGVVLVDDSPVVRAGLRTLIALDDGIEILAEAGDGDEAVRQVRRTRPDVVLLDVRMPRRDGLSAVRELVEHAAVVMLTFSDEPHVIHRALQDGARGYLVHGTFDADSLGAMVRSAAAGGGAFSGPALEVLRSGVPAPERPSPRLRYGLSERQAEVMDLIAQGRSNREIAAHLFVAEKTVKNHINQIFAALGVSTRARAIVLWLDPPTQTSP